MIFSTHAARHTCFIHRLSAEQFPYIYSKPSEKGDS